MSKKFLFGALVGWLVAIVVAPQAIWRMTFGRASS